MTGVESHFKEEIENIAVPFRRNACCKAELTALTGPNDETGTLRSLYVHKSSIFQPSAHWFPLYFIIPRFTRLKQTNGLDRGRRSALRRCSVRSILPRFDGFCFVLGFLFPIGSPVQMLGCGLGAPRRDSETPSIGKSTRVAALKRISHRASFFFLWHTSVFCFSPSV